MPEIYHKQFEQYLTFLYLIGIIQIIFFYNEAFLNTSFDEVDYILKSGTKDDQLNETINNLRDVTDILSPIYFNADMKSDETTEEHSDTFSRKIVDLTELLVGHHVATMFAENNLLISFIVPCYNAERYIQKCLDSILNQTFSVRRRRASCRRRFCRRSGPPSLWKRSRTFPFPLRRRRWRRRDRH